MAKWVVLAVILLTVFSGCVSTPEKCQRYYDSGYDAGVIDTQVEYNELIEAAKAEAFYEGTEMGKRCQQCDLCLNNPTYIEVTEFIAEDCTDTSKAGNCVDYSACLIKNARSKHMAVYPVILNFYERGSHLLTAFETSDKGLVFIEPQTDEEVDVHVGGKYNVITCKGGLCEIHKYTIRQMAVLK